ncbi:MAG: TonB-dependent receptor [Prolixibacteraceae bacterium]|nr:TonB-dependent receptor [Prolixibacteraceae bacterium]
MKLSILNLITLLFLTFQLNAQQARVKGSVTDAATGETLLGASVILEGTTVGAMSDFDGNYVIDRIQPGTYNLVCKFISYKPDTIINVVLADGDEKVFNFLLSEAVEEIAEVKVVAKINRESENLLLLEQKNSAVMTQNIGASELSRKGAGDIAAGVKKVTGVSMMGSKQLFVRGLGDRFNSAQLNGLPITSPDPVKKIIKLDIFPSDIVKVLNVSKVFTTTNYADYTGALINIETKDYPAEPFLSISVGSAYNSNSTFNPFKRINAEGATFFGFDVNSRKALTPETYKVVNRLLDVGEDFNYKSYNFTQDNAMPAFDFSIKGGKQFDLNYGQKLGILASVAFNNGYQYYPDVLEVTYNKQKNDDGNFINQEYSYNTLFSSLVNVAYSNKNNHSVKYNFIFLNNGEDGFKEKRGYKRDWGEDDLLLIRSAEYINYKLLSNQLTGKHKLSEKFTLNWRGGYMNVTYDIPDRREIIFQQDPNKDWQYFSLNPGNDTKRLITSQKAWEANGYADATYKLGDDKGSITAGLVTRYISQNYNSYFFGYKFDQAAIRELVVDTDNPNEFLTPEFITEIDANTSDDMGYEASLMLESGFVNAIYNISSELMVNAGLRVEYSLMELISNTNKIDNDEQLYSFSNLDLFPSLNFKYSLTEKANFRLALSRTVTRPSFYEKTPVRMIPEAGKKQIRGNPYTKENPNVDGTYLENSYSYNIDLKYEMFPETGEIISLGVYYKHIVDPIERVSMLMGGSDIIYTYRNFIDNATAAGAEFEIKKQFGKLFTGLNASYIYTHLTIPPGAPEINTERTLQGASPYLINADLGYTLEFGAARQVKSYIGLVYNVFGKRLTTVGVSGAGNQYELPFHSFDIVLKNKIDEKFEINLSVKNILNQDVQFVQDVYTDLENQDVITDTVPINVYNPGISVSLGLSYKF